jgi:hypothetical protein
MHFHFKGSNKLNFISVSIQFLRKEITKISSSSLYFYFINSRREMDKVLNREKQFTRPFDLEWPNFTKSHFCKNGWFYGSCGTTHNDASKFHLSEQAKDIAFD